MDEKAKAAWEQYKRGFEQEENGEKDMIEGWDTLVAILGRTEALKVYWAYAKTTEYYKYGMCDPDGCC